MWGAKMGGVAELGCSTGAVPALPSILCESWAPAQRRKIFLGTWIVYVERGREWVSKPGFGERFPAKAFIIPSPDEFPPRA